MKNNFRVKVTSEIKWGISESSLIMNADIRITSDKRTLEVKTNFITKK